MPTSFDSFDSAEYVRTVARACQMPEVGIRRLLIEYEYPGPVVTTFEYIKKGEPALMDVMPRVKAIEEE